MESYRIENLSFAYHGRTQKALSEVNLTISSGEFVCVCGKSGCGKTTLLRLLKPLISPHGELSGRILFGGEPINNADERLQAEKIGFVMQNPDNQIVTDKVWHELAFGLESLGFSTHEIRKRVAEMASFFGIDGWFHEEVSRLSGGQKQLLNLASCMVMQPDVVILDEPTSQLDPIAAGEFLNILVKINRELGTTIILSEHRLEEIFPVAHQIVVMDNGKILVSGAPKMVAKALDELNHDMVLSLPTPSRVYGAVEGKEDFPLSVREGKLWLERYSCEKGLHPERIPNDKEEGDKEVLIELKEVFFRYEKSMPDVIKGLSFKINKGEIFSVLGGNGSGKTTFLSLLGGLNKPYRGDVFINGRRLTEMKKQYGSFIGILPQNPECLFTKKTLLLDLLEMEEDNASYDEKKKRVVEIATLCKVEELLDYHPYDLSGGERQRAALCMLLLKSPDILLLDEPTKGFDSRFKEIFADILSELKDRGKTIIMVSHDIEFCANVSDRCGLFFDGIITTAASPRRFFSGNSFYTTSASRMSRGLLPNAVLAEDIVLACGKNVREREKSSRNTEKQMPKAHAEVKREEAQEHKRPSLFRIITGSFFALCAVCLCVLSFTDILKPYKMEMQLAMVLCLSACFLSLTSGQKAGLAVKPIEKGKRLSKRDVLSLILVLLMIPLTIFLGMRFLDDRRYYFISLLIILETIVSFLMVFEKRKVRAKELVIISVLCALAVAGRCVFFSFQQFKPVLALIIISGISLGAQTGFLIGVVTGFVSNFFFGQGPWTPWQMFAFGMIGLLAGVLFKVGLLKARRTVLCIFGFAAAVVIYGVILNVAHVLLSQELTAAAVLAALLAGLPFDVIHGISTAFFLWFISIPMLEKLERVKVKMKL